MWKGFSCGTTKKWDLGVPPDFAGGKHLLLFQFLSSNQTWGRRQFVALWVGQMRQDKSWLFLLWQLERRKREEEHADRQMWEAAAAGMDFSAKGLACLPPVMSSYKLKSQNASSAITSWVGSKSMQLDGVPPMSLDYRAWLSVRQIGQKRWIRLFINIWETEALWVEAKNLTLLCFLHYFRLCWFSSAWLKIFQNYIYQHFPIWGRALIYIGCSMFFSSCQVHW